MHSHTSLCCVVMDGVGQQCVRHQRGGSVWYLYDSSSSWIHTHEQGVHGKTKVILCKVVQPRCVAAPKLVQVHACLNLHTRFSFRFGHALGWSCLAEQTKIS